jgi:hypothetical protein
VIVLDTCRRKHESDTGRMPACYVKDSLAHTCNLSKTQLACGLEKASMRLRSRMKFADNYRIAELE